MSFELVMLEGMVLKFILIITRVTAFFINLPILGNKMIPVRIKLGLTLLLSWLIFDIDETVLGFDIFSLKSLLLLFSQFIYGFFLASIIQVLIHGFSLAAQLLSYQIGLGFAQLQDPQTNQQSSALGQFFTIMITLLILSTNLHLYLLAILVKSFIIFPINIFNYELLSIDDFSELFAYIFKSGLSIALPMVFSLLLITIGLGVITKAAPQFNIFSIGFPLTLMIGFLILTIFLPIFDDAFLRSAEYIFGYYSKVGLSIW